jgi:hypothetical protein
MFIRQQQAAHRMSRFSPSPSILTAIKTTRTGYAQLMGQRFYPPKVFGQFSEKEGTKEWRWRDLGMKVVCLADILLLASAHGVDNRPLDLRCYIRRVKVVQTPLMMLIL